MSTSPFAVTLSPEDLQFCAAQGVSAEEYVRGLVARARAAADPQPGFGQLVDIMARLRDPQHGCPWDLKQTHQSLKKFILEEAYEVLEAIDLGSMDKLCEELGDLLLQTVFHAQLASEAGAFTIDDVTQGIADKLVRRHPHVFGSAEAEGAGKIDSPEAVLRQWEQIKRAEHGNQERTSILDGIPPALPALLRALEVSQRVVKVGFEWPTALEVLDKVREETAEIEAEIRSGDTARAAEELGDLLFTIVNLARKLGADPEDALRQMTMRFAARFRFLEEHARAQERPLEQWTLPEMETVWQAAKREHSL